MRRRFAYRLLLAGTLIVATAVGIVTVLHTMSGPSIETMDAVRSPSTTALENVGLCPWRSPDADRLHFFPSSTGFQDETIVLSRHRAEIASILGHAPAGPDNILPLHWILRKDTRLGAIMTRAVRGESGLIELVLAVDQKGSVVGAKLQRLREPDSVARVLQSPRRLGALRGKTASSNWRLNAVLPDIPSAARISADAVLDGARTMLVLLEVGRPYGSKSAAELIASQRRQALGNAQAP